MNRGFTFVEILLLPSRCKTNTECIEFCKDWIDTHLNHRIMTDLLKFFEIGSLVAKLSIFEAITAIFVRFSFSWILVKGHQATFAGVGGTVCFHKNER